MKPVFVIGDVHGHIDRLLALLEKADTANQECITVQLGDLGHFGRETKGTDQAAWLGAREGLVDYVLWGNHDRAVVDSNHHFGGYDPPEPSIKLIMNGMERDGRLLMGFEAHGWLITHAGLHKQFKYQNVDIDKTSAGAIADWLNERMYSHEREPIIAAVSGRRGGGSSYGGILWRDIAEKLYDAVPQVFGHSASPTHVVRGGKDQWHCIDIGGRGGPSAPAAECLAGIWLPSQEIVRVDRTEILDHHYQE